MVNQNLIDDRLYGSYLSFLLNGQRNECHKIVKKLLDAELDIKDIYIKLFQRSLYDVGSLWEHNKISVAVEHLATSITEGLMSLAYPVIFSTDKIDRSAIITCMANEYHQIGGRMVADIFELNGWNGYFLGANTPYEDLCKMIDDKQPHLVGLSLSVYYNIKNLLSILERLSSAYPTLKIIVGGQAFRQGGKESLSVYANVQYIESLYDLEEGIIKDK